jgi:hypothetical protein
LGKKKLHKAVILADSANTGLVLAAETSLLTRDLQRQLT